MIIYFSGTGNSRFAAEFIAKELQDEVINAGKLIKAEEKGNFISDKPYVFVCPIYSWRMLSRMDRSMGYQQPMCKRF